MLKLYIIWMFSMGIFNVIVRGDMECIHSNICNCYKSNELEYQCPPDNFSVVVHTVPQKYVKIDCYQNIPEYNLDIFPNIDVGDLEYFSVRFCPLPKDGFNYTLEKFNISKIQFVDLEEVRSSTELTTVTKGLFYGISGLTRLSFSLFKIKLEEDFLEFLPNLTVLYLDNNEIREIGGNMFKNVPKLRVLHLSRNVISYLPDRLFENLSNLQQLHLWKNELTTLNKNSFVGLRQLKSLELSSNKLISIDDDTFTELIELVNISLRSNNLHVVSSDMFQHNTALEGVRIGDNPNLNLTDYLFANFANLSNINIDNSKLKYLPEHIFEGSTSLIEISLKNNDLVEIPEMVFDNLNKLKKLNLEGNAIEVLPDKIFYSLTNLEILNLEGNQLEEINDSIFRKTSNLQKLNLRYNKIITIHLNAFIEQKKLLQLDLAYNKYRLNYGGENVEGLNPFSYCEQLRKLNLSHNEIHSFPENIMDNKVNLVFLDLDYNKIREIRMASLLKVSPYKVEVFINNNNVSVLDFREIKLYSQINPENYDAAHNVNGSTVLYLSHNPIKCDCSNFDLIQYTNDRIHPVVKTLVDIRIGDIYCAQPKSFNEILVKDVKPNYITCPFNHKGCPKNCFCQYRPYDNHVVVNCSSRNLTNPPSINFEEPVIVNYYPSLGFMRLINKIEVDLEDNSLETAPYRGLGYDNVTKLFLSNNHIKNVSWIPPHIEILHLNGNNLKMLDSKILEGLNKTTTLKNLTLYGNPWSCGCSAITLQNYLRNHFTKIKYNDVICEDNKPLIDQKELCKSNFAIITAITTPILIILLTTATAIALYFYYQEQIKVWLYAKNLCLWFVTEEELDKDKTYDVFISYSHKDEDFVLQNLLPVLEQGPNPFKVCIHIRDWIPGEFIASQVTNSVLDSRRTLVVLSESFLESVWGKMEFRTAHTQAISDGRARVIVLKYGNINEEKLDSELKSYLKTNTYVEWGDPWFWNKLKYALPHSRQNKFYNNQKHANIMLKIDDKFELVTTSPTLHAESTPPVMPLDPSLLKDHPLNFKSADGVIPSTDIPLISR